MFLPKLLPPEAALLNFDFFPLLTPLPKLLPPLFPLFKFELAAMFEFVAL